MDDAKSRLRRVVGDEGLARLDAARVAVVGLGGVGASCAEALVRGGIGSFVLADRDAVEPSNINRQAIAFVSTVGQRKVDVMAAMVADINPAARVTTLDAFLTEETLAGELDALPRPDYLVDAVDTLTAKAALARYAVERGIPFIGSMGMANRSDPTKLAFADLFATEGCPFCREMRKIARDRGISAMQVLYSKERPQKVAPAEGAHRRERTELGTYSYMPPIAGQMLASWVIRDLLR